VKKPAAGAFVRALGCISLLPTRLQQIHGHDLQTGARGRGTVPAYQRPSAAASRLRRTVGPSFAARRLGGPYFFSFYEEYSAYSA
jgi:hypothetical protein